MGAPRIEPSRRDVLRAATATPLIAAVACHAPRDPSGSGVGTPGHLPRNLLLIVSDDQSRTDLGCYGNPACSTPNIDRLASEGARFECGYTPVPLCQPARSSIYTGLYPHRNGATGFGPIRAGVPTWPELLGGECFAGWMGKRNVQPPERFPFDVHFGVGMLQLEGRDPARYERFFAELLDRVGERRFAAIVNLRDPHRPFQADRFVPEVGGRPAAGHSPGDVWVPPFLWDTSGTRDDLAAYYDALRRMDDSAGRVLRVLAERGHAGDTLVVFTSDNGMPFPFGKSTLYEPGINVPFVVRWPGVVEPGRTSRAFVNLVDLLPTALETFGVPRPRPLDGRSLLPLLRGETSTLHRHVVAVQDELLTEPNNPHRPDSALSASTDTPVSRSIRDRRYKYVRNFHTTVEFTNNVLVHSQTWQSWKREVDDHPGLAERMRVLRFRPKHELFDLERDPWELENLAFDREQLETRERLRSELKGWMVREGDPMGGEFY